MRVCNLPVLDRTLGPSDRRSKNRTTLNLPEFGEKTMHVFFAGVLGGMAKSSFFVREMKF